MEEINLGNISVTPINIYFEDQPIRKIFLAYHNNQEPIISFIEEGLGVFVQKAVYYFNNEKDRLASSIFTGLIDGIKDMNLVIVPITKRVEWALAEDRKELLYLRTLEEMAQKNNVPFVPVIVEDGAGTIFNQVFGTMQGFDYSKMMRQIHSNHPEQMDVYKRFVKLIDGEESNDVDGFDDAPDSTVFISYRKKDFEYLCRLREVWNLDAFLTATEFYYDDYLTLQEDYTQEIKEKIASCNLFVLLITPSLYENNANGEINYVQAIEYPLAVQMHKTIMPIYAGGDIDWNAFVEAYPGIDAYYRIDQHDVILRNMKLVLGIHPDPELAKVVQQFYQQFLDKNIEELRDEMNNLYPIICRQPITDERILSSMGQWIKDDYEQGTGYLRQENLEYAEKFLAEAIQLCANYSMSENHGNIGMIMAKVSYQLAEVYCRKGDYRQALVHIRVAMLITIYWCKRRDFIEKHRKVLAREVLLLLQVLSSIPEE